MDRRVEITGPVDRKMVINALNSGAKVYMADLEDSQTPTWRNQVDGQRNLYDAVRGHLTYRDPDTKKEYELADNPATLIVRPRGWHLPEKHLLIHGEPISGSLFDFGLFVFHNARRLLDKGSGPYLYLAKMENANEAALWADVFDFAIKRLDLPSGCIKATVLIEHLLASFEMHEILYNLRNYAVGLNCGRWDYIFSYIKTFRNHPQYLVPDRSQVTMLSPFMRAYSRLAVQTCHRRGAHAMGGMAAQIPIKGDEEQNQKALAAVVADKNREVGDGHDGTWVAHPALVPIASNIFNKYMPNANQIDKQLSDLMVTNADLTEVPKGTRTEAGLRYSINVTLGYLEAWLRGQGCVPLYNLMEDAATAEITRALLWQWVRHGAKLDDGALVDASLIQRLIEEETGAWMKHGTIKTNRLEMAGELLRGMVTADELPDFLTLQAYDRLVAEGQ